MTPPPLKNPGYAPDAAEEFQKDNIRILKYQTVYILRFIKFLADVDECMDQSHNCDFHAQCLNTEGSFKCWCNTGYNGNGTVCTGLTSFCCLKPFIFLLLSFKNTSLLL